jgi:colanic acid/amylovoran biosynthesis glycosyltransferase
VPSTKVPRILYIVSRFPTITETFVVNEWLVLSKRFRMELASLLRSKSPLIHPPASTLLPRVWFAPLARVSTFLANGSWLMRRPRTYLALFIEVLRGSWSLSLGELLKGTVVFFKSAALAKRASDLDVAHVHAHFANHPATAAWVAHRLLDVPFSFTAHANDLFVRPALLERKVRDAKFVVAVSEYNHSYIRRKWPSHGRVEVIHCGVDPMLFRREVVRGRRRRLICVAGLVAKKGHRSLVRAFSRLRTAFPDLELVLVGDGPERARIARLADELRVESGMTMLGGLSSEEVRAALADADIFVLASIRLPSGRMEGIPVALMEAMAMGVAVVATDLSGIPELVMDEVTGLLVPPGDPRRLAHAIRRLIEDDALVHRLVERASHHVIRYFNLEVEANRLGDLFARPCRPRIRGGR